CHFSEPDRRCLGRLSQWAIGRSFETEEAGILCHRPYDSSLVSVRHGSSREAHRNCHDPAVCDRSSWYGSVTRANPHPPFAKLPDKVQVFRIGHIVWLRWSPWRDDGTTPVGGSDRPGRSSQVVLRTGDLCGLLRGSHAGTPVPPRNT